MQLALMAVLGSVLGLGMRRILFWRRVGFVRTARRLYRLFAWSIGLGAWLSMLAQETVLLYSGLLTWQNALPLHLCSMLGLLSLPMLLSGSRMLWHASLYLGIPGALLALIFPAVMQTKAPEVTTISFYLLHIFLLLAPILPFSLGWQPSPRGAASAWMLLMLLGCVALAVNGLLGSNYLFLHAPLEGTPLMLLPRSSPALYALSLALLSLAVLLAEGTAVYWVMRYVKPRLNRL